MVTQLGFEPRTLPIDRDVLPAELLSLLKSECFIPDTTESYKIEFISSRMNLRDFLLLIKASLFIASFLFSKASV